MDPRQAASTHSCFTSIVTLALGDKGPRSAPERFSLCSPVTPRTCYKTMIPVLDVTSCRVDFLVTDRQLRPFVKTNGYGWNSWSPQGTCVGTWSTSSMMATLVVDMFT